MGSHSVTCHPTQANSPRLGANKLLLARSEFAGRHRIERHADNIVYEQVFVSSMLKALLSYVKNAKR